MKKTRLIAGLLALMTACSLCACGNDASSENAAESAVQESAAETAAPAEDEEEASESEADDDSNDAGTEESSINTVIQSSADYQPEDPASDEELAEVKQVLDDFFKANAEKDYDTLAKVYDVELLYFMDNGKTGDAAKYKEFLQDASHQGMLTMADPNVYEIDEPLCYNSHAGEYNDFLVTLNDYQEEADLTEHFKIDGLYSARMRASSHDTQDITDDQDDDVDVSGTVSGDINIDTEILIFRINGEWKCDLEVSMAKAFYSMFSGMSDEEFSMADDDFAFETEEDD